MGFAASVYVFLAFSVSGFGRGRWDCGGGVAVYVLFRLYHFCRSGIFIYFVYVSAWRRVGWLKRHWCVIRSHSYWRLKTLAVLISAEVRKIKV